MRTLLVLIAASFAISGYAQEVKPAKAEEINASEITVAPIQFKEPLYIVDGNEMSKAKFDKINPDHIASIDIFKDNTAISRYGDKGANGVIVVKMKRKE